MLHIHRSVANRETRGKSGNHTPAGFFKRLRVDTGDMPSGWEFFLSTSVCSLGSFPKVVKFFYNFALLTGTMFLHLVGINPKGVKPVCGG